MKTSVLFLVILYAYFFFDSSLAMAASQMIGVAAETPVYPRPNIRYRPIHFLKTDATLKVAAKLVKTSDVNFYKVLLYTKAKKRVVGYVIESANVRIKTDSVDDDDFANYSETALSSSSISSSAGAFRGSNYLVTLGYEYYLTPGFYIKYYLGEWFSPTGGGDHFGIELGNDNLISRMISLQYALSAGPLIPAQNSGIFAASQADGINYLFRGIFGIRLNEGGRVSFGIAGVQSVIFNQNSSLVTFGGQLSIEVGIF